MCYLVYGPQSCIKLELLNNLVSDIWKFTCYQFESQIASKWNRLPFVLLTVDGEMIDTVAYDTVPVLYCNI